MSITLEQWALGLDKRHGVARSNSQIIFRHKENDTSVDTTPHQLNDDELNYKPCPKCKGGKKGQPVKEEKKEARACKRSEERAGRACKGSEERAGRACQGGSTKRRACQGGSQKKSLQGGSTKGKVFWSSASTECKSISDGETTYFGTVSDGFTASEVHKGGKKLISLLGMASGFLGPEVDKLVKDCKDDYLDDLREASTTM